MIHGMSQKKRKVDVDDLTANILPLLPGGKSQLVQKNVYDKGGLTRLVVSSFYRAF